MAASLGGGAKLAAYLDCGRQAKSDDAGPVKIELLRGRAFGYPARGIKGVLPSQAAVAFDERQVAVKVTGLAADRRYDVGLTWWDFASPGGRTQSVLAASPDGEAEAVLVKPTVLPNYKTKKALPATVRFALPAGLYKGGAVTLLIRNDRGANAVLSEMWLVQRH